MVSSDVICLSANRLRHELEKLGLLCDGDEAGMLGEQHRTGDTSW